MEKPIAFMTLVANNAQKSFGILLGRIECLSIQDGTIPLSTILP
ncbi:MAG: hypothetical protein ACUVQ4_05095 [bacterium]